MVKTQKKMHRQAIRFQLRKFDTGPVYVLSAIGKGIKIHLSENHLFIVLHS